MLRVVIFLCLMFHTLHAQKHGYNWTFGDSCGLNFNFAEEPEFFESRVQFNQHKSSSSETQAAISNANGDLEAYISCYPILFPSLGLQGVAMVYDGKHRLYINGDSIKVTSIYSGGALFLPSPYHLRQYVLLTVSEGPPPSNFFFPKQIYLHIVDADAGLVVTKNQLIHTGELSDKVTAVRHANGVDWWILAHERTSNRYLRFLVTDTTVHGPWFQDIGSEPTPEDLDSLRDLFGGQASFSSDGTKFLNVHLRYKAADLFDFDRCTGLLSNYRTLPLPPLANKTNPWWEQTVLCAAAFSKNNSYIYIYIHIYDQEFSDVEKEYLYQFDLKADDLETGRNTVYYNSKKDTFWLGNMRLAPNGKIYLVGNCCINPSSPDAGYLSVIEHPDSAGPACGFRRNALYLQGHHTQNGLPNMANYELGAIIGPVALAGPGAHLCPGDSVRLGAPPVRPGLVYRWRPSAGLDDSTSAQPWAKPTHTTTYTLTVTDTLWPGGGCNEAKAAVTLHVTPTPNAGRDTAICRDDSVRLGAPPVRSGLVYRWLPTDYLDDPTSPQPWAYPQETTTYILTVTDPLAPARCGVASDTVALILLADTVRPCFTSAPRPMDDRPTFRVYPNPAQDEVSITSDMPAQAELYNLLGARIASYALPGGETRISTGDLVAGTYILRLVSNSFMSNAFKLVIIR